MPYPPCDHQVPLILNAIRTPATRFNVPALAGSLWLSQQSLADGETLAQSCRPFTDGIWL